MATAGEIESGVSGEVARGVLQQVKARYADFGRRWQRNIGQR